MAANHFKVLRWLPVCFIILLVSWLYSTFTFHILMPLMADGSQGNRPKIIFGVYNTMFGLMVLSFLQVVRTDPGQIPASWVVQPGDADLEAAESGSLLNRKKTTERKSTGGRRICRKSRPNVYKPDRAHFCRISERCVLRMDHFCPWINNCVGFYNQKYFVLFVAYNCFMTWFMLVFMANDFGKIMAKLDDLSFDLADRNFQIVLAMLLLSLLCLGLTGFFLFHCYLVACNYTTIEFLEKRTLNPDPTHVNRYHVGIFRNIQAVMGKNPLEWPFPIRWHVDGNGLEFPTRDNPYPTYDT